MSKKRYIVCLNSSTKEQDLLFIDYVKKNNLGWWHWLSNTWFLYDTSGKLKASDIRDSVKQIYQGGYFIVLEITENGDTWSGFGPIKEDNPKKNMFAWIQKNWKKGS